MNWTNRAILVVLTAVACAAVAQIPTPSITVDCDRGQSLNDALSKLNKQTPTTVSVNGTCTEFVQVIGFENLTLKGLAGAKLLQPITGAGNVLNSLLFIESSRSVTVSGFSIQADTITDPGRGDRSWQQRHPAAEPEHTRRNKWNRCF